MPSDLGREPDGPVADRDLPEARSLWIGELVSVRADDPVDVEQQGRPRIVRREGRRQPGRERRRRRGARLSLRQRRHDLLLTRTGAHPDQLAPRP